MDFGAAVALRDCVFFAGVVADAFEVVSPGFTDTAGFVGAAGSVDVCSGDAVGTGSSVSVGSFVSTGGPDTTGVFVGAGVISSFFSHLASSSTSDVSFAVNTSSTQLPSLR